MFEARLGDLLLTDMPRKKAWDDAVKFAESFDPEHELLDRVGIVIGIGQVYGRVAVDGNHRLGALAKRYGLDQVVRYSSLSNVKPAEVDVRAQIEIDSGITGVAVFLAMCSAGEFIGDLTGCEAL